VSPFSLADVTQTGTGLARPECVLATRRGDLFVAHLGCGVLHIAPDGTQRTIGAVREVDGTPFVPNGLALLPDGSFLIANMGQAGGLWKLDARGRLSEVLRAVDGQPLGATNFVTTDSTGRIWVTVTSRQWPISLAMTGADRPPVEDGYLVLLDGRGARIVADGFAFANEVRLSADERAAYVVETFGRRITRFRVGADGALDAREVFVRFGRGTFADGAAFDSAGGLWVASIVSNRLLRVDPEGRTSILLDEEDPAHTERIERKLDSGTLEREDVQRTPSRVLKNIASITFGGPDLRTVYLGSLGGDTLATLRSPVAGAAPVHWDWGLPPA
jgi:sugar lactone lactonase YvrE